jgi:hypothetical protein
MSSFNSEIATTTPTRVLPTRHNGNNNRSSHWFGVLFSHEESLMHQSNRFLNAGSNFSHACRYKIFWHSETKLEFAFGPLGGTIEYRGTQPTPEVSNQPAIESSWDSASVSVGVTPKMY